mgnify:CR=1
MTESENSLSIFGRKVFFIAPNLEFMPETYLQTFLSYGYECYAVRADASFSLPQKIKAIISLFPGSLFIFDTTSSVAGIQWESYIQALQQTHGDKAIISVVYSKKWSLAEKTRFKSFYANTAKIKGGYIGLEPGAPKNFERLNRILIKNNAGGRRKTVRVNCDDRSTLTFAYKGQNLTGKLVDISITHFSCDIDSIGKTIPVYEKIRDMTITVNGMQFVSDAAIILRRSDSESARYIFMFIQGEAGVPGLKDGLLEKLAPQIYAMVSASCAAVLKKAYSAQ